MDTSLTDHRCPKCGAALPQDAKDAPLGCPACLFAVGAEPASELTDGLTSGATDAVSSGAYANEPPRFSPGDLLGAYRIVGLVGRGGMGEVYEAVAGDGRRVALKLLRERLAGSVDRDRFLREGVLAASVTHRNCVYVYGSDEIDGLPVIVMELAPGGTLKRAVEQFGPRTPVQAVAEILQVVDGLEAAAEAGILHRDVKPSNCFIDADGGIKVGDFGLSMSLNASDGDITWKPTFQGTPEFAAPEQLRGEPLDVRADIYGVGATLFFLLTGYSPFGERNIKKLIELKTGRTVITADAYLPGLPSGLTAIVGRCMSPDPNGRAQTYGELRAALLPFITPAPVPSSISRRLGALMLDSFAGSIATPLLTAIRSASFFDADRVVWVFLSLAYFSLFERFMGATPGKLIAGIRVIDVTGRRPTLAQAAARWVPSIGLQMLLAALVALRLVEASDAAYRNLALAIPLFALFSALYAHTRSDHAMFHDAWTGTRVVRAQPAPIRAEGQPVFREPPRALKTTPADIDRVGPFDVIGKIGDAPGGDLLLGRDPRLRRFVWIHRRPNAPGALPAVRRQLAQPTRLRWLAGDDGWDAFEAPDGRAFQCAERQGERWPQLISWLVDLSRDLEAAEAAGALPALAADHLWLLTSGRVMMLDFRAPGAEGAPDQPDVAVPRFLERLMRAPGGSRPIPRRVTLVLNVLVEPWMTAREAGAILHELARGPLEIARRKRVLPILACVLPAIVFAAGFWLQDSLAAAKYDGPDAALRAVLDKMSPADELTGPPETRALLRLFVANSFRDDLSNPDRFWNSWRGRSFRRDRAAIEHSVRWYAPKTAEETQAAETAAQAFLRAERARKTRVHWPTPKERVDMVAMWLLQLLVPIAVISFAISFVAMPFLFRLNGLALEDADGLDAPMPRRVARALFTWWPVLLLTISPWLVLALLAAGAAYALVSPERAIQDRLAGTFVVPR